MSETRILSTHDRGLGSAYERYCFYQWLETWRAKYDIRSALEGPKDGMAGILGVHLVGLAQKGVRVTSALDSEETAAIARAVYEKNAPSGSYDVRVVSNLAKVSELPESDMVVLYHSLPQLEDWQSYLKSMAKLAKKVLIVTVCNPKNWGVSIIRTIGRLRGIGGLEPPAVWHTETLAPELWSVGRVREHVYFDSPWWPDLQVSAGQSLKDRAAKLFTTKKRRVEFTALGDESVLANKFVYGPDRWPYFGGTVGKMISCLAFSGILASTVLRRKSAHASVTSTVSS